MNPRRPSTFAAAIVVTATMLLTTACSSPNASDPAASATPAPAPTSPTPTPEVTESEQPLADPTCDTIILTSVVEDFAAVGWTSRAEPFRLGAAEVPDGVQCVWGDFTVASDHVQIFGWAPMSESEASKAQDKLVASGWRQEDTPDGVIVTENSDRSSQKDAEGYGLTYLFGDGWVKYADTKQGLLLIVWPAAG